MKNEENEQRQQDQNPNQGQNIKKPSPDKQSRPQQSPPGNEKSNISVGNDGRIGKAHDRWNNDYQDRNSNNQQGGQQSDQQVRSNNSAPSPEIDTPIYDPEKTEKKIPQLDKGAKK